LNLIGDEGAKTIGEALQDNQTLNKLDLSNSYLLR
jgi:hypothetical protein